VIFQDSRYQNGTVTAVLHSDGVYHTAVFPPVPAEPATYITIRTMAGDDYTKIAGRAYGDPELWWHVAYANPQIFFPDQIPVNTLVVVPDMGSIA
jgi:nucleoid-associated protein YgaU